MKITIQYVTGVLWLLLLFTGCESQAQHAPDSVDEIVYLETPADTASLTPELVKSSNGQILLSWMARNADGGATLHTSSFLNEAWTPAKQIVQGDNWFINWADFPTMAAHDAEKQAASFLTKSAGGTYTYDVQLTVTEDGGNTWLPAFMPHKDGVKAEHGFVSLFPWENGQFKAIWLDGRNTGGGHHGSAGRAMTIRSAVFDAAGNLSEENELDNRVCDCCQTAAVRTGPASALVAYRDRSADEIRDIAVVRYANGSWSSPEVVHADGWEIAGCPVNGPALDASEHVVTMTWFTAAQGNPRVQFSVSIDRGKSFGTPVLISDMQPAGRVGVSILDASSAVVTWLQPTADGAADINLQRINWTSNGELTQYAPVTVAQTRASRQSGFPQVISDDQNIVLAWTSIDDAGQTHVRSARIKKSSPILQTSH